jgi:RNA polymerase sigma-70 factor (ECF subfamily)
MTIPTPAPRSEPEPGRSDPFAAAVPEFRRDVILLCYRFLGSLPEAEEAAQETALRAWRARDGFRGDASLRTWLHRIAARVCLDLLRARRARVLPQAIRAQPADPTDPPEPPATEIAWLGPLPDDLVTGATHDPAARYDLRESVSLAFIAALQLLPPRQRAVLLLRDVIGSSARETAAALEMSVPAANSALHRAREALRATHHRTGPAAVTSLPPDDAIARRLLDAYVRAWQADDVAGLVATMREDVRLAMPPTLSWYAGRAAIAEAARHWIFGALRPESGYTCRATSANGQPALVFGAVDAPDRPLGLHVLEIADDGVREITISLDPAIAARALGEGG